MVLEGTRAAEFDQVVENADSPLTIGPIAVRSQELGEGRKKQLENRVKLIPADGDGGEIWGEEVIEVEGEHGRKMRIRI